MWYRDISRVYSTGEIWLSVLFREHVFTLFILTCYLLFNNKHFLQDNKQKHFLFRSLTATSSPSLLADLDHHHNNETKNYKCTCPCSNQEMTLQIIRGWLGQSHHNYLSFYFPCLHIIYHKQRKDYLMHKGYTEAKKIELITRTLTIIKCWDWSFLLFLFFKSTLHFNANLMIKAFLEKCLQVLLTKLCHLEVTWS